MGFTVMSLNFNEIVFKEVESVDFLGDAWIFFIELRFPWNKLNKNLSLFGNFVVLRVDIDRCNVDCRYKS